MFRKKVCLLLLTIGVAVDVIESSGYGYTCDSPGVHCGSGYVCQMIKPPHCASCPEQPQCVPPTTCDGVECPTGTECEVQDAPHWCPDCPARAICKAVSPGVCDSGEAYDYQEGKCVPISCDSPDACTDGSLCTPANPGYGYGYCHHQYQQTGVPCKYFTCEFNPCTAALCPVGEICEVVYNNGTPQAQCVCDTPTYVFNDFEQKCVPNSCDAGDACPADTTCVPGGDPDCVGNCRPYTCVPDDPRPCPDGYVYDEYNYKCIPDPCAATTCPFGAICVLTHDGAIGTDCVCDTPTYVFSSFEQKCVPNSCDAVNACPADTNCVPGGDPDCSGNCRPYTCVPIQPPTTPSCGDGYEFDAYQHKCVAVSCEADPCPSHLVCVDDDSIPCVGTPCFRYSCVDPTTCDEGYEYDNYRDKCVPVNCKAPNACPAHKDCVDDDSIQCSGDHPCKKYYCQNKPTDPCAYIYCGPGTFCDSGVCCPNGTAYDDIAKTCVAVSCDAPNPCPAGKQCVDDDSIVCVRAPCAQFTCENPSDPCAGTQCPHGLVCKVATGGAQCVCPDNYEWHPYYSRCVPKNCEAENPCPGQQECVPHDRYCPHPGPCPKYYCQAH